MTRINEKYVGSKFEDFLAENGILEEVTEMAIKSVFASQIQELMRKQHITKSEMAKRMETSRTEVDRLLNPKNNANVTLGTMDRAAIALGKRLNISLI